MGRSGSRLGWAFRNSRYSPPSEGAFSAELCRTFDDHVGHDGREKEMTTAQKGIVSFGLGLLICFVGASWSVLAVIIGGLMIAVGAFIWALNKDYDS